MAQAHKCTYVLTAHCRSPPSSARMEMPCASGLLRSVAHGEPVRGMYGLQALDPLRKPWLQVTGGSQAELFRTCKCPCIHSLKNAS